MKSIKLKVELCGVKSVRHVVVPENITLVTSQKKYFPQETDAYAAAIAKVGAGAYVIGESVLGFYHLCPTHEAIIHIGTPNRVRRRLPQTIQLEKRPAGECLHLMDGVPAQTIGLAIRTAMGSVEPTRIREAIEVAAREQLIQRDEAVELLKEMGA